MMETPHLGPRIQVFVCTNERADGDCCASVHGMEIFRALKQWVREQGLTQSVWVTRTGCMTFCNDTGTTVVIHPQNVWFTKVVMGDLAELEEQILRLSKANSYPLFT